MSISMEPNYWGASGRDDRKPRKPPRPRVRVDDDGTLDDFLARDVELVHFEALDDSQWYATIKTANGEVWQLNFGAVNPRAKGYARAEKISE